MDKEPPQSPPPPQRPLRKRKSGVIITSAATTKQTKYANKKQIKIQKKSSGPVSPKLTLTSSTSNTELLSELDSSSTIIQLPSSSKIQQVQDFNNEIINNQTTSVSNTTNVKIITTMTNTRTSENKPNLSINSPFSAIDMELDYDEELDDADDSLEIEASDDLIDFVEHDIIRPTLLNKTVKQNNKTCQQIDNVAQQENSTVNEYVINKDVTNNCKQYSYLLSSSPPLSLSPSRSSQSLQSPLPPSPSQPSTSPPSPSFLSSPSPLPAAKIDSTDVLIETKNTSNNLNNLSEQNIGQNDIENIKTMTINKKKITKNPLPIKKRSMVNLLLGISTSSSSSSSSSLSEEENYNKEKMTNKKCQSIADLKTQVKPITKISPKNIASKVLTINDTKGTNYSSSSSENTCTTTSSSCSSRSSSSCCNGIISSSDNTSSCSGCSKCSNKKSTTELPAEIERNKNDKNLEIPFSEINELVQNAIADIFCTDEEEKIIKTIKTNIIPSNNTTIIPELLFSTVSSVPRSMPIISLSPIPSVLLSSETSAAATSISSIISTASNKEIKKPLNEENRENETNKFGLKLAASLLPSCFVKLTKLNDKLIKSILSRKLNKQNKINGKIGIKKEKKKKLTKQNSNLSTASSSTTTSSSLKQLKVGTNTKKKIPNPNYKRIKSMTVTSSDGEEEWSKSIKSSKSSKSSKLPNSKKELKKLKSNDEGDNKKLSKLTGGDCGSVSGNGSGCGDSGLGNSSLSSVSGKPKVCIMLEKQAIKLKMKRLKKNAWKSTIVATTTTTSSSSSPSSSSMSLSSAEIIPPNKQIDITQPMVITDSIKNDAINIIGLNNFENIDDNDLIIPLDIDEENTVIELASYINDDTIEELKEILENDTFNDSPILDLSLPHLTNNLTNLTPLDLSIKLSNHQQDDKYNFNEPLDLSIRPKEYGLVTNCNKNNITHFVSTATTVNKTTTTTTPTQPKTVISSNLNGFDSVLKSNSLLQLSDSKLPSDSGFKFPDFHEAKIQREINYYLPRNNNICRRISINSNDFSINNTKNLKILYNNELLSSDVDDGSASSAGTSGIASISGIASTSSTAGTLAVATEVSNNIDYKNRQPKPLSQRREFVIRENLDANINSMTINVNATLPTGGGSVNNDVNTGGCVDNSLNTGHKSNNNTIDNAGNADYGIDDSTKTDEMELDELSDDAISLYAPSLGCISPRDIEINSCENINKFTNNISNVVEQRPIEQSRLFKIPKIKYNITPQVTNTSQTMKLATMGVSNSHRLTNGTVSSSAAAAAAAATPSTPSTSTTTTLPPYKIPNIYTRKLTTTSGNCDNNELNNSNATIHNNLLLKIFGKPCYKFLNNKCNNPSCFYEHSLPAPELIRTKLSDQSCDTIGIVYRTFILRYKRAFIQYFQLFAELFGIKNQKNYLLSMIRDCESFPGQIMWYLKFVYTGLLDSGLSRIEAAKEIIARHTNNSTETIDVIVDIIIDSNILYFVDMLEIFVQQNDYHFKASAIKKLIDFTITTKNKRIIEIILKILDKSSPDILQRLEQELSKFVLLLKSSNMLPMIKSFA